LLFLAVLFEDGTRLFCRAHSEENARDKAPTRREREAAMDRKREEFIVELLNLNWSEVWFWV
jgi:hypothetical protein